MSVELLQKLEHKINFVLETIELMAMQIEELEEKNSHLREECTNLKSKQSSWEKNLTIMLDKLDSVDPKDRVATKTSYQKEAEAILD